MTENKYSVGQIVVNDMRQHAKIVSLKNGIYGLTGWTSLENAKKDKVANKFVNIYGLTYANLQVVSANGKANKVAPQLNVAKKNTALNKSRIVKANKTKK